MMGRFLDMTREEDELKKEDSVSNAMFLWQWNSKKKMRLSFQAAAP